MALRNIVTEKEARLRKVSRPVEKFDERLWTLLDDMADTMYEADGCGLAAPQVGVLKQIVVIDCDYAGPGTKKNPYVLINPKVVTADGDPRDFKEGCLSFPGINVTVTRPSHVVVHAYDLNGDLMQYEAEGNLMAVCLQHEIDHLHGKTMVDHLAPIKRAEAMREYDEAIAAGARPGETEVAE